MRLAVILLMDGGNGEGKGKGDCRVKWQQCGSNILSAGRRNFFFNASTDRWSELDYTWCELSDKSMLEASVSDRSDIGTPNSKQELC